VNYSNDEEEDFRKKIEVEEDTDIPAILRNSSFSNKKI
jgi:hypothetical protein